MKKRLKIKIIIIDKTNMKFYDCLLCVHDFYMNRGDLTALFHFFMEYIIIFF